MYLKKPNKIRWAYFTIIVSAILIGLGLYSSGEFRKHFRDSQEWIMSYNPGVSDYSKLSQVPITSIARNILRSTLEATSEETLYLDIPQRSLDAIENDRQRALSNTILTNPSVVKAEVRFGGKKYKADVRLKGDLQGHWYSARRASLKVKLKKGFVAGFREFSLQKPAARQFPDDQIYHEALTSMGGIAPAYEYLNVVVNGTPWGRMLIEESIDKYFLEKKRLKESLVLKFGNEKPWAYRKTVKKRDRLLHYRLGDQYIDYKLYNSKHWFETKHGREQLSYILGARLNGDDSVYDFESFLRNFSLANVWGNYHSLADSNSKYYFNPYTLKLEPVSADQGSLINLTRKTTLKRVYVPQANTDVYRKLLDQPFFEEHYWNYLQKMSDMQFSQFVNNQDDIFDLEPSFKSRLIRKNLSHLKKNFTQQVKELKASDYLPFKAIETEPSAPSERQLRNIDSFLQGFHYSNGEIGVFNRLNFPVFLEKVVVKGEPDLVVNQEIPAYSGTSIAPQATLRTELRGIYDGRLRLRTSVNGIVKKDDLGPTLTPYGDIVNPLIPSNFNLGEDDVSGIELVDDAYYINEDQHFSKGIVVDRRLVVGEGVTLSFDTDAFLIIKGGLDVQGTISNPVSFEPASQYWKGLFVLGDGSGSNLSNTIFKNTSGVRTGILNLTGGVTFYEDTIAMNNVEFNGTIAEDALNTVNCTVDLKNILIRNTRSDGYDSDFSNGAVIDSSMLQIGGDALDTSGSQITARNLLIKDVHDKALSIGEASVFEGVDLEIAQAGVGIVAKDGSKAELRNSSITKSAFNDAMVYVKKDFFPAATLVIEGTDFGDGSVSTVAQSGSTLLVNGAAIGPSILDVDALYREGVMKK